MKNAIILCSGGIDSFTSAFYSKYNLKYSKLTILFFNYGQKSLNAEEKASKKCAKQLGAEFIKISLPELAKLSTSLINKPGKRNRLSKEDLKDTREESKNWYVPCRNLVFASYAIALSDSLFIKNGIRSDIIFGFKCEGNDSYPDTTEDFVASLNKIAQSSESHPKIIAPLINMDKEDIIKLGAELNVNFKDTFSCYIGKNKHCGTCLACRLRQQGFYWAGVKDPTEYLQN